MTDYWSRLAGLVLTEWEAETGMGFFFAAE
jgi:hypothetical protein